MSFLDPDMSRPWAAVLLDRHAHTSAQDLISVMAEEVFPGRIALVSSFGAESAVLAHMVAQVDKALPVVFVDTGKLFGETRRYRDRLAARLGLTDLQIVEPLTEQIAAADPNGLLHAKAPDTCCYWRKVEPLQRALGPYKAWLSGRKRFHGGGRADLPRIEAADKRIKINPLADWTRADLDAYFTAHDLPRHPLQAEGYLSIGCMPCTDRVAPGEDPRAGRWRGLDKDECGIHLQGADARRRALA